MVCAVFREIKRMRDRTGKIGKQWFYGYNNRVDVKRKKEKKIVNKQKDDAVKRDEDKFGMGAVHD